MLHDPPSLLSIALIVLCASALLVASLHDLVARTIPNGIALAIAVCGLGLRAADGNLPAGILAGAILFICAAFCWRRGLMGGGDVKLIAATAVAVPPAAVLSFVAAIALSGGVLAMLYLAGRCLVGKPSTPRPQNLFARVLRIERWRVSRGGPLPYACAIAAGGLFILL
jgi:prepilin peptidase CpaA